MVLLAWLLKKMFIEKPQRSAGIGEPYWNKGIATVAVKLITEYGFDQLNYVRIHTGVFEYNIGSMKVLERNEYKKDGVFEKAILKNGQIWNEHRYSKIK